MFVILNIVPSLCNSICCKKTLSVGHPIMKIKTSLVILKSYGPISVFYLKINL